MRALLLPPKKVSSSVDVMLAIRGLGSTLDRERQLYMKCTPISVTSEKGLRSMEVMEVHKAIKEHPTLVTYLMKCVRSSIISNEVHLHKKKSPTLVTLTRRSRRGCWMEVREVQPNKK